MDANKNIIKIKTLLIQTEWNTFAISSIRYSHRKRVNRTVKNQHIHVIKMECFIRFLIHLDINAMHKCNKNGIRGCIGFLFAAVNLFITFELFNMFLYIYTI